jgi:hypothetical protein
MHGTAMAGAFQFHSALLRIRSVVAVGIAVVVYSPAGVLRSL